QRNGHRPKLVSTPAGDVELGIPKLRQGSFFPELLEPRRRIDKALWAVIMTAYITGTSTRKVDDLVKALGCDSGISKSTVSRICTQIDADVHVLRTRRLDHQPFVYVWLDATYVHVRENRRVVSKAIVIATGLRADGHREVLGLDVGDSENETFWKEFLTDLNDRGLAGVRLVISDAHAGLVKAIRRCFQNAGWQRCRVHAMRNLLAAANHRHRQVIAALIRTIFVQPDTKTATAQLRAVVEQLRPYAPGVAERLEQMETDLLAYTAFPVAHWSKIWSNNPIERLNRELKRRTDVVGIFPDKASVIQLAGALLVEINDEMVAAERRYIAAASVADLTEQPGELALPAAPRNLTNSFEEHTVSYTTPRDAIKQSTSGDHHCTSRGVLPVAPADWPRTVLIVDDGAGAS
ncbi:MAG: IS256 family transposase, partial [Vicinamibacterales bacterium]